MVTHKQTVKAKEPETIGFRFTPEDRKLLLALRKKLGIQSVSDVMRQGLRALAAKEGVTV